MITPYKIDHESIISKINSLKLVFLFLEKPKTRNLNLIKACFIHTHHMNTLIWGKQYHLVYFRQYVFYKKKKEQQLQNSILQKRILEFQSKIEKKVFFSDLPNAFWKIKHVVDLFYDDNFNGKKFLQKQDLFKWMLN